MSVYDTPDLGGNLWNPHEKVFGHEQGKNSIQKCKGHLCNSTYDFTGSIYRGDLFQHRIYAVIQKHIGTCCAVLAVYEYIFSGNGDLFFLGRINYRSSERFRAEIPITFSVGTRKGNGITCDVSENGLAFITDFPEFLHGVVDFELQDEKWNATVSGEIVHVGKIGDKWRYSVKLVDLPFEEKQNYDQIVFDRLPTLAAEIKTGAVKDLLVFFKRKTASSVLSQRKLPRIVLNASMRTDNGSVVHVLDYNYQYMLLTGAVPDSEFDLYMGRTALHLKKTQSSIGGKDNLFEIENWENISDSLELHEALLELIQGKQMEEKELVNV